MNNGRTNMLVLLIAWLIEIIPKMRWVDVNLKCIARRSEWNFAKSAHVTPPPHQSKVCKSVHLRVNGKLLLFSFVVAQVYQNYYYAMKAFALRTFHNPHTICERWATMNQCADDESNDFIYYLNHRVWRPGTTAAAVIIMIDKSQVIYDAICYLSVLPHDNMGCGDRVAKKLRPECHSPFASFLFRKS